MSSLSYEQLFEGISEGIAICCAEDGKILDANTRFTQITGYGKEEIEGQLFDRLIPEVADADGDSFQDRFELSRNNRIASSGNDTSRTRKRIEWSSRTVSTADGTYILVSAREASNHDFLQEHEAYRWRLDGAMIESGLAWWEMDVETGRIRFHDNKAELLGYTPDQFEHYEDFTTLVHEADYDRIMGAMEAHLEGEKHRYDVEYRIATSGGEYRWCHDIGGVTERGPEGTPQKVTGVVIDITHQKRLEERLQTQNDELALLHRLVRHDIRNQMAVALGWLESVQEDISADRQADLDRVIGACNHTVELTKLSHDLMDVIVEDDTVLKPEAVDLREILTVEIEKASTLYEDATITIGGEIPSVSVMGNALLSSVFSNLLNNAVQHNDTDTPTASIAFERTDESIRIHIADNGPGIPEDQQKTVFGRGEKGLESDGTGMGLYLVDTLVDAYGGDVWIEDNDSRGSIFVIELMLA